MVKIKTKMKKQNKVILGVVLVTILVSVFVVSTNSSLLQGNIRSIDKQVKTTERNIKTTDRNITRAEFAKLLAESASLTPQSCDVFADVPQSHWSNVYVCALYSEGLLSLPSHGNFRPTNTIQRAEAAKLIHTTFTVDYSCPLSKMFTDLDPTHWAYDYINQLAAYDFFSKEIPIGGNFKLIDPLTISSATKWFSISGNL